jgi:endonuclease/exonuclease/phosphatase family metal-dependent hydrolase
MRVLTLNLWGRSEPWDARRASLVAGLRALAPDLVAFQECLATDAYDEAADLLGGGYRIAHAKTRERGSGITIASRWPIEDLRELDLHVTPRIVAFPAATLVAAIDAPAPFGRVLFANHFPSWELAFEHERELQASIAARAIEELVAGRAAHVILAGDLDADPNATSIRFWTGRASVDGSSVCYRDAWESAHPHEDGHTFTKANANMRDWDWPFGRIDYVLVRCGMHGGPTLAIDRCALAFDAPVNGVFASDHFGVVADLSVPASGSR